MTSIDFLNKVYKSLGQPIGHIGYCCPAEVWISEHGKLYAK